jgi:hypothetical protein
LVSFAKRKLQVFVSSTYSDLRAERQAAVEAILTAGHIPAGMELFTSGDESQMEVITQWIDESDVYLLILGGRYGSIDPKSGKSYTQLEYEYAVMRNKPLFSCVITKGALEEKVKKEGTSVIETDDPQSFRKFTELVLSKLVRFWDDYKDIKIAIGETLSTLARREDLAGWVRSNSQVDTPALADEMARLSKENSILRIQTASNPEISNEFLGLTFAELVKLLEHKEILEFFITNSVKLSLGHVALGQSYGQIELPELLRLGLVQHGENPYYLIISESGKRFLNRYELQNINKHT